MPPKGTDSKEIINKNVTFDEGLVPNQTDRAPLVGNAV